MSGDQLGRPKELEKENERQHRAVSDLTLDKQILKEAAFRLRWSTRTGIDYFTRSSHWTR